MLYKVFLVFCRLLPLEWAHILSLKLLRYVYQPIAVYLLRKRPSRHPVQCGRLLLANPLGLAAGLDKDGCCLDAWFAMGFGFVELGTVTPRPQKGNPRPRLFRLEECSALINRMGFNNRGVDALVERLKHRCIPGIVGVNIGKNYDTPLESAAVDYQYCLEKVYCYADYVVVNISSPNTPGLRQLQDPRYLDQLLSTLLRTRQRLRQQHNKYLPLWIKISPDLSEAAIKTLVEIALEQCIDGVIVSNTSTARDVIQPHRFAQESGGLSGHPLFPYSKRALEICVKQAAGRLPIIAVGGIDSPERARTVLDLGATAIQVYSALIYQGPAFIHRILGALS